MPLHGSNRKQQPFQTNTRYGTLKNNGKTYWEQVRVQSNHTDGTRTDVEKPHSIIFNATAGNLAHFGNYAAINAALSLSLSLT